MRSERSWKTAAGRKRGWRQCTKLKALAGYSTHMMLPETFNRDAWG